MRGTQVLTYFKLWHLFLFWAISPSFLQAQSVTEGGSDYQRFAAVDLTGVWVSVVTEDWQYRMITPAENDFTGLFLNQDALDMVSSIDLDQIEVSGSACQAFAAPTIMREPGRVRISWEDGDTLKIETDAGEQTRLFHFANFPEPRPNDWQGFSKAEWIYAGGFVPNQTQTVTGRTIFNNTVEPAELEGGKLKVETTNLQAGIFRKNGVPFSDETEVTEYYNLITGPTGTEWLIITTRVHDPVYMTVDHITSTNFKREQDDSSWNPRPCTLR